MSGSYSTWPFACPTNWSEAAKPAIIRSDLQDGYPKVRRQFTKDWAVFEGRWSLPIAQAQALRDFYSVSCQAGALPFTMTDPLTGAARLFRWVEPPRLAAAVNTKPYMDVSGRLEEVFS